MLGEFGEQLQAGLQVALVALVGDGCGEHAIGGLGGGAYVADGDLVLPFRVVPGFRAFTFLDRSLLMMNAMVPV